MHEPLGMEITDTSTSPPRRTARLTAVAVLGVVSAAGVGASFTQRVERTATDRFQYPAPSSLRFGLEKSSISVDSSTATGMSLVRAVRWSGPDAPATATLEGDELKMRGCTVPWWKEIATFGACSANYRLTVPTGQNITASADLGSLSLSGTYGTLKLTTDVGDISSNGLSVRIMNATVGVGDMNAVFTTAPERLVARSDIGDITLTVPVGQYNILTSADVGSVKVDQALINGQNPRTIDVRSGIGDVTIRAAR